MTHARRPRQLHAYRENTFRQSPGGCCAICGDFRSEHPEVLDVTALIEREGWDCAQCGHRHAGATLANICVGCPCPETALTPARTVAAVDRVAEASTDRPRATESDVLSDLPSAAPHPLDTTDEAKTVARGPDHGCDPKPGTTA